MGLADVFSIQGQPGYGVCSGDAGSQAYRHRGRWLCALQLSLLLASTQTNYEHPLAFCTPVESIMAI